MNKVASSNSICLLAALVFFCSLYFFHSWPNYIFVAKSVKEPVKELRIAFFGDQGLKPSSLAVLWMIKEWNADAIVHLGDFDYEDDPEGFDDQISGVFGPTFPYLAAIGNHDIDEWPAYKKKLEARLKSSVLASFCTGETGIKMNCDFNGVQIVLSGVGTFGTGHELFIESSLSKSSSPFKICAWHKNQHSYQTGDKEDEIGWEAYETCRSYGAIITSGHTHTYARTHLMADYENHKVESTEATLRIRNGTSFAVVVGTGGYEISDFPRKVVPTDEWWAHVAAQSTGLTYGAVLCKFNVQGTPNEAYCEFRDIKGRVWDEMYIKSALFHQ